MRVRRRHSKARRRSLRPTRQPGRGIQPEILLRPRQDGADQREERSAVETVFVHGPMPVSPADNSCTLLPRPAPPLLQPSATVESRRHQLGDLEAVRRRKIVDGGLRFSACGGHGGVRGGSSSDIFMRTRALYCRLGQHLVGRRRTRAVGGAGTRPPARQGAVGLRWRAFKALVGDGDVGRDRVSVSPGSVSFSDTGTRVWACVRVIFQVARCACKVRSATCV